MNYLLAGQLLGGTLNQLFSGSCQYPQLAQEEEKAASNSSTAFWPRAAPQKVNFRGQTPEGLVATSLFQMFTPFIKIQSPTLTGLPPQVMSLEKTALGRFHGPVLAGLPLLRPLYCTAVLYTRGLVPKAVFQACHDSWLLAEFAQWEVPV